MPNPTIKAAGVSFAANLTPTTIHLPTTLNTVQNRTLASNSLAQVKQAIAPLVQQMVQAAGFSLNPAQLQEVNQAFMNRGIISIGSAADAGNTISVETNSLNWSSSVAGGIATQVEAGTIVTG